MYPQLDSGVRDVHAGLQLHPHGDTDMTSWQVNS